MSKLFNNAEDKQTLRRLVRQGTPGLMEASMVASPGGSTTAWPIKVKSLASYNVYNVIAVTIPDPGSEPTEIGQQTQAVNLAEPFLSAGSLPTNTYAIMFRVGNKNIFYVQV